MIPTDVQQYLDKHGLKAIEFEEGSTPTAVTAAEKLEVEVGQIAKSILLKGKNGKFYLVVVAGDKRIDNKKAKALTGAKTRMATAEELFEVLGFKPGEVCPFRDSEIDYFIDASLAEYDIVYPAAGTDSSGVPLTYDKLTSITGAGECDITV
ncbi:MAG: YbaK/EbsC family protein [Spirochaetales bacterium]|uniref:YbaK/EbsC family protein n=1 Tax=Candidatus Thalassospirochaeta sargassi TaxID=3119039 RepID=A0AAJ1IEP9_9SPIO|nr:YbaK/EbsC family protein [Spirochaetales bacterium]